MKATQSAHGFLPPLSVCSAALALPLHSSTVEALRETIWSTAMELFHSCEYERCMEWLQRYAKRVTIDDIDNETQALRAMAIVSFEVGSNARNGTLTEID